MVVFVFRVELYLVVFSGTGILGIRLIFGGSWIEGMTCFNVFWRSFTFLSFERILAAFVIRRVVFFTWFLGVVFSGFLGIFLVLVFGFFGFMMGVLFTEILVLLFLFSGSLVGMDTIWLVVSMDCFKIV